MNSTTKLIDKNINKHVEHSLVYSIVELDELIIISHNGWKISKKKRFWGTIKFWILRFLKSMLLFKRAPNEGL